MFGARITPKIVAFGLGSELLLLGGLYVPAALGWTPRFLLAEAVVMTAAGILAFGSALLLSLEVAAEYQPGWARLAWLMLAASAALSLLKRCVGSPLLDFVIGGYRVSPLRGLLDNALVVPSNLCLLGCLVAMWWSIHRLGLGFRIERRDYVAMAGVAALFLTLVLLRGNLSQGQSPYVISRFLQPIGLGLLAVVSAFAVALRRYTLRMGDGKLATVIVWLMVYVLLRGALVLARSVLRPKLPLMLDSPSGLEAWAFDVLWQVVQWAAAMAAACGAQLTASAAEQLRQLRAGRARKEAALPA
jgi:hypothetical protein